MSYSDENQELRRLIEAAPKDAKVKGMFVESFLKSLEQKKFPRPTQKRYFPFSDYSLQDWMMMMLDSTERLHPHLPPRDGLRLLGQLAYPTLIESTVGKVIFSVAGRSFNDALGLSSKAYAVSLTPGSARLVRSSTHSAVLELREVWNFADCYQVGVMEGAMAAFRVKGTVVAKVGKRPCDVDLTMHWSSAS